MLKFDFLMRHSKLPSIKGNIKKRTLVRIATSKS
nr:MAG TPA: hypothetical protein [Caudoviricetes sp.]